MVFFAVLITVFIVALALMVDSGRLFLHHAALQRAADAASLNGASRVSDLTQSEIETLAQQVAEDNLRMNGVPYDTAVPTNDIHPAVDLSASTVSVSFTVPFMPQLFNSVVGERYVVDPPVRAEAMLRPLAVVIAADFSNSMLCRAVGGPEPCENFGGSRLQALYTAGASFLDSLDEQHDAIALIGFNIKATTQRTMTHPFKKEDLKSDLMMISVESGTNIHGGLINGRAEFARLHAMVGDDAYRQFVKLMIVVTDGAPTTDEGKPQDLPPGCNVGNKKQRYIWPLIEADAARAEGIYVFVAGVGKSAAVGSDPYQDVDEYMDVKTVFLRRLANDSDDIANDPAFPHVCVPSYTDILSQPKGELQTSTNANDLTMMLNRLWRTVRLRHTL